MLMFDVTMTQRTSLGAKCKPAGIPQNRVSKVLTVVSRSEPNKLTNIPKDDKGEKIKEFIDGDISFGCVKQ
mgnify:CR=1 FL=1